MIIAHRGAVKLENTLESVLFARDLNVSVEIDVQTCKSGEIVLFHDETLERLSLNHEKIKISDLTLEEIQNVELIRGYKIPTLEDILKFWKSQLLLNIELKNECPNLLDLLNKYDYNYLITSYSEDLNKYKKYKTGKIFDKDNWNLNLLEYEHSYVIIDKDITNKYIIESFKNINVKILVYTVNNLEDIPLGVDGIITDKPYCFL